MLAQRFLTSLLLASWHESVLVLGMTVLAALLFSQAVFRVITRLQAAREQRYRELLALHRVGLDIAGELDLEIVLQKIVDAARELVGARYGALSVPRRGGGNEAFVTSGLTDEERARLGPLPTNHGLLGVVAEGARLRLPDLAQHPGIVAYALRHGLSEGRQST